MVVSSDTNNETNTKPKVDSSDNSSMGSVAKFTDPTVTRVTSDTNTDPVANDSVELTSSSPSVPCVDGASSRSPSNLIDSCLLEYLQSHHSASDGGHMEDLVLKKVFLSTDTYNTNQSNESP